MRRGGVFFPKGVVLLLLAILVGASFPSFYLLFV